MRKVVLWESLEDDSYIHHPDYTEETDVSHPLVWSMKSFSYEPNTEPEYKKIYPKPETPNQKEWQKLANTFHKRDTYIAVTPDVLNKVVADGRLKNQHETNTSNGCLDPDRRKRFEDRFFKRALPSLKDKPYPIYGYLSDHPKSSNDYDTINMYGTTRLKLKPHMRQHTTFTIDDSLEDDIDNLAPSHLTAPHWASLTGDSRNPRDPNEADIQKFTKPHRENDFINYFEAQIHHPVHMHDVESIHVFPHHGNSRVNYDQISKDHNIPVHYYDRDGTGLTKEEFHIRHPDNKFGYEYKPAAPELKSPIDSNDFKTNYKTELGDEIRF